MAKNNPAQALEASRTQMVQALATIEERIQRERAAARAHTAAVKAIDTALEHITTAEQARDEINNPKPRAEAGTNRSAPKPVKDLPEHLHGLTHRERILAVMRTEPTANWRVSDIAQAAHIYASASASNALSTLREDGHVIHDTDTKTWRLATPVPSDEPDHPLID